MTAARISTRFWLCRRFAAPAESVSGRILSKRPQDFFSVAPCLCGSLIFVSFGSGDEQVID